jgi:hypothetical protein
MTSVTQRVYYTCPTSPPPFKFYIITYIHTTLEKWSRKCKRMRLKTEDNCCVHNLLFTYDQVVIIRGAENPNYGWRELEYENGDFINSGGKKKWNT